MQMFLERLARSMPGKKLGVVEGFAAELILFSVFCL